MTKKRSGSRHELGDEGDGGPRATTSSGSSPALRINTNLNSPPLVGGAAGGAMQLPPPFVLSAAGNPLPTVGGMDGTALGSPVGRRSSTNSPRMFYPKQVRVSGGGALTRSGSFSSGTSSLSSSPLSFASAGTAAAAFTPSPSYPVRIAMLSKNMQSKVEFRGVKGEVFSLGEIYLNDLSDIRVFEISNMKPRRVQLLLKLELRKPFQVSQWGFQLENENLDLIDGTPSEVIATEEFNHVPFSVLRSSSKAALCAENVYLCEGYNELFNHIGTVEDLILEPNETKRVVFSLCAKLSPQHNTSSSNSAGHASSTYALNGDSSEEERMHLHQTSCTNLVGRLVVKPRYLDRSVSSEQVKDVWTTVFPAPDIILPLQGQVCRSLLRLDVKELHFDDCVPDGSFVKDFTVWNRSEIPLLFKLVSSLSAFDETKDLITCTDYNTGYVIGDRTLQAAAYGHVRVRVTYRPEEVKEFAAFFRVPSLCVPPA